MRKCANCGHPEDKHGKGMLLRKYCIEKDEGQLTACLCSGFVMDIKEEILTIFGERERTIGGIFEQRLTEEKIEISESELARLIYELFREERISISNVPS